MEKGLPTNTVLLAGNAYQIRFDVLAMSDVEQQLELMKLGASKKSFFQLMDSPYDIREETAMLLAGINAAKRLKGETDLMDMRDMQALLTMHFEYIASQADGDMEKFKDLHAKLWESISNAARNAMGFRKKAPGDPPELVKPEGQ